MPSCAAPPPPASSKASSTRCRSPRHSRCDRIGTMSARPRGLAAVAAGTALIATGFTFRYPELAVLGAAAIVAAACAIAYVAWRPALTVRRTVRPDRVGRGEPCTHTLTVRLAGRLRPATLLADDRCGGQVVPVPLVRLRPGHDTDVDYPVPTDRRGVVEIGRAS